MIADWYQSFNELYLQDIEYFVTKICIAFLLHVFISIILLVLSEQRTGETKHFSSRNVMIRSLLRAPLVVVREVFRYISKLKLLTVLQYHHLREKRAENRLEGEYILFQLSCGFIMAVVLLLLAKTQFTIAMVVAFVWTLVLIVFMIGLGEIRRLHPEERKNLEVGHTDGTICIESSKQYLLEGRVSLLGVSLHAGMIGIVTTIGTGIVDEPLIFTLVPITFDMISVSSALLEFPGLKVIIRV